MGVFKDAFFVLLLGVASVAILGNFLWFAPSTIYFDPSRQTGNDGRTAKGGVMCVYQEKDFYMCNIAGQNVLAPLVGNHLKPTPGVSVRCKKMFPDGRLFVIDSCVLHVNTENDPQMDTRPGKFINEFLLLSVGCGCGIIFAVLICYSIHKDLLMEIQRLKSEISAIEKKAHKMPVAETPSTKQEATKPPAAETPSTDAGKIVPSKKCSRNTDIMVTVFNDSWDRPMGIELDSIPIEFLISCLDVKDIFYIGKKPNGSFYVLKDSPAMRLEMGFTRHIIKAMIESHWIQKE